MNQFGAEFLPNNKFTFPLRLISSSYPISINYEAGTSAQLKSAVILAGLNSLAKLLLPKRSTAEIIPKLCFLRTNKL